MSSFEIFPAWPNQSSCPPFARVIHSPVCAGICQIVHFLRPSWNKSEPENALTWTAIASAIAAPVFNPKTEHIRMTFGVDGVAFVGAFGSQVFGVGRGTPIRMRCCLRSFLIQTVFFAGS